MAVSGNGASGRSMEETLWGTVCDQLRDAGTADRSSVVAREKYGRMHAFMADKKPRKGEDRFYRIGFTRSALDVQGLRPFLK